MNPPDISDEMPKASSRPSFPTSSSDFALPPSSSSPVASSSSVPEEPNPLLQRFRRPSLLTAKANYATETRLHSPLASSFTFHPHTRRRMSYNAMVAEESESDRSDKERTWMDPSPPSSADTPTPPLRPESSEEDGMDAKSSGSEPLTPPRKVSLISVDENFGPKARRLSFPLKQPRILNLLAESRPEENEVKSEAAFQRLVSSCSELPMPRTPRTASDRGRYPEEAGQEESQREETPSDDEDDNEVETAFAFYPPGSSDPISIVKPITPASSVNGDDLMSESPGGMAMDVDVLSASPSVSSVSSMSNTPINQWRYTPPPTTSAVRSNKRKFDDRFDPYPSASKRRAVSPSLSIYLRDAHTSMNVRPSHANPRLPIAIPISIPGSTVSSAASSPTIAGSYSTSFPRPGSIASSPTIRTMGLASPILRPVLRAGRRLDDERDVDGAGEGVGGLSLGS